MADDLSSLRSYAVIIPRLPPEPSIPIVRRWQRLDEVVHRRDALRGLSLGEPRRVSISPSPNALRVRHCAFADWFPSHVVLFSVTHPPPLILAPKKRMTRAGPRFRRLWTFDPPSPLVLRAALACAPAAAVVPLPDVRLPAGPLRVSRRLLWRCVPPAPAVEGSHFGNRPLALPAGCA
jgi:hypothetical protein